MNPGESIKNTGIAQVIVVLKPSGGKKGPGGAAASVAAVRGQAERIKRHFRRSEYSHDSALLDSLRATSSISRAAAGRTSLATIAAVKTVQPSRYFPNLGIMFGTVDQAGLAALRSESSVSKIVGTLDFRMIRPVKTQATKPKAGVTWGLEQLGVPQLWSQGLTGKGVLVGHLDTGIDGKHPALKGAIATYAEFDSLGNQVPGAKPVDSDNHGTHTAGTIAGRKVKSVSFGVAPEAMLASARVIEGGNVIARILGGIDWAIGNNVRILNMSLGLPGYDEMFRPIVKIIRKRGILPVFAVGNEGPGTSRYPGNYPEALSVGALDEDGYVADFSSSQLFKRSANASVPLIVGPGVDVLSCTPGNTYELMSGSSMATPHIAGLAALLIQAKPKITVKKLEAAIIASCKMTSKLQPDRAGKGMPFGPDALKKL